MQLQSAQYYGTGASTFYFGSSQGNDCASGLKLAVTFGASNVVSASFVVFTSALLLFSGF